MNRIILRTNQNSYFGGETIYGVVYVKIASPTSAVGVILQLKGYETYVIKDRSVGLGNREGRQEYIDHTTDLYKLDGNTLLKGPWPFGKYKFPFQKTLPDDLASTFSLTDFYSEDEVSCDVKVFYTIQVSLKGAEHVQDSQDIIIKQILKTPKEDRSSADLQVSKYFGLTKGTISSRIRLDKTTYITGETATLHLDIENQTGQNIRNLEIQLHQKLVIQESRLRSYSKSSDSGITTDFNDITGQRSAVTNLDTVIWRNEIKSTGDRNRALYDKGMSKIFIKLCKHGSDMDLLPSTSGKYVQCNYYISGDIILDKGDALHMEIPIHAIHSKEIDQWKEGTDEWTSQCITKQTIDSDCYVLPDVLDSEQFNSFPGFELLL